jgi:PTH2 family peptidyl-tRNA hydrolase
MSIQIKQVIVYRRDLNMRKGKIAAQVAHASMKVLFDRKVPYRPHSEPAPYGTVWGSSTSKQTHLLIPLTDEMSAWVNGLFAKVVLSVENEADLLRVYELAQEADIPTALITDAGKTEFKKTCTTCEGVGLAENVAGIVPHVEQCPTCEGEGRVSVPTHTTVAIGPAKVADIDKITGPKGAVICKLA